MKLLVVEGNPKSIWQPRIAQGGVPYHQRFVQLLRDLGYTDVTVAFAADGEQLPDNHGLRQFNGILLTGSSLNIYDEIATVTRQLDFAEHCFASGVPIYGSCWGLQVAVTVAGGKIGKGKNGREYGIAKNITLTKAGKQSSYFTGKPDVFDAYCIHEDDTHALPDNAEVLATNAHSDVQALTLHHKQSPFFGVQYHPEFTYDDVELLANLYEDRFIAEGIFSKNDSKADCLKRMADHPTINDRNFHTAEVGHWSNSLC